MAVLIGLSLPLLVTACSPNAAPTLESIAAATMVDIDAQEIDCAAEFPDTAAELDGVCFALDPDQRGRDITTSVKGSLAGWGKSLDSVDDDCDPVQAEMSAEMCWLYVTDSVTGKNFVVETYEVGGFSTESQTVPIVTTVAFWPIEWSPSEYRERRELLTATP
jgi:hypothetical protein